MSWQKGVNLFAGPLNAIKHFKRTVDNTCFGFSSEFLVDTDANNYGIGAVLSQAQSDGW